MLLLKLGCNALQSPKGRDFPRVEPPGSKCSILSLWAVNQPSTVYECEALGEKPSGLREVSQLLHSHVLAVFQALGFHVVVSVSN